MALHRATAATPSTRSGVTEQNFLRGVQVADADGNLSFTSIYPGAYDGRWPHIHFEVFQDLDTATSGGRPIVTSQIALPEGASREAYLTDGYEPEPRATSASSSIDSDMVFSDGYDSQLATVDRRPHQRLHRHPRRRRVTGM